MKKILLLIFVFAPLVSWAQVDDIYYVPKKKELVIKSSGETYFSDVENYRTDVDVMVEEPETEVYYTDDLSDLSDYRYSRRIIRFRGLRCNLSSNLYLDLKYGGGFRDWLVLDNGYSIDIYPTANNPLFFWGGAGVSLNIWNWNSWHYAPSWSYYSHWNCWPHNHFWDYHPYHWHNPGYWHNGYWGGGHVAGNHYYRPSHRVFRNIPSNGSVGRSRNDRNSSVAANRVVSAGKIDAGGRDGKREEKRELALKRQQRRKDNAESMRNMQQRMSRENNNRLVQQRELPVSVSGRDNARYENRNFFSESTPQVQKQPVTPVSPASGINLRPVVPRTSPVDNTQKLNRNERRNGNVADDYNSLENRRRRENTGNQRDVLFDSYKVSRRNSNRQGNVSSGYNRPSSTSVSRSRNSAERNVEGDKRDSNSGILYKPGVDESVKSRNDNAGVSRFLSRNAERNDEVRNSKSNSGNSFVTTIEEIERKKRDVKPVRYKEYENISKSNSVDMTNVNGNNKIGGFEFDYDKPAPWQKHHSNTSNTPSSREKAAKDASGRKQKSIFSQDRSSSKKSIFGDHSRDSSKKSGSSRSSSSGSRYSKKSSSSSAPSGRSVRSSSSGSNNRGSATRGNRGR